MFHIFQILFLADMTRGHDLGMLEQFNSRERDAADWEAFFGKADGRFRLVRCVSVSGSILSVIEFGWVTGYWAYAGV